MRSQVNVRMPDDLRAELEAAARKRGRNVSEELLVRLRASFISERDHRRDPATRAFAFLVQETAEKIRARPNWHRDPFMFKAFKIGVARLLDTLEPAGDVRPPFDLKELLESDDKVIQRSAEYWKTPETAGQMASDRVLQALYEDDPIHHHFKHIPSLADRLEDEFYAMSQARRDLQIRQKKGD